MTLAKKTIWLLATLSACGYLQKMGMVAVTAEQKVPRPAPGHNIDGVQVVWTTLETIVNEQHGEHRPSLAGRQLRAWLTDYDTDQICLGIEDYPAMNASLSGTANPFERLDMSLVRSDGAKLTKRKLDRLADDLVNVYLRNEQGVWADDSVVQYYYATARACFTTKELFITPATTSLTWNVGDSHYTFKFEGGAVAMTR